MAVKPIPDGYTSITPYLVIKGAAKAMEFYKKAFGAVEIFRMPGPNDTIGHAEMQIGNARFMLADEFPQMGFVGPETIGGTPVGIMLYVENVDKVWKDAIAAGGKEKQALKDQFYGDRSGTLVDPWGHLWTVSQHVEDVAPEELARRAAEMGKAAQ